MWELRLKKVISQLQEQLSPPRFHSFSKCVLNVLQKLGPALHEQNRQKHPFLLSLVLSADRFLPNFFYLVWFSVTFKTSYFRFVCSVNSQLHWAPGFCICLLCLSCALIFLHLYNVFKQISPPCSIFHPSDLKLQAFPLPSLARALPDLLPGFIFHPTFTIMR